MDKHILTNNRITDDKTRNDFFPDRWKLSYLYTFTELKELGTQKGINKNIKHWTAPNISQMNPQRKYRLRTVSNNYLGGGGVYGEPTFTHIFRRGYTL